MVQAHRSRVRCPLRRLGLPTGGTYCERNASDASDRDLFPGVSTFGFILRRREDCYPYPA